MYITLLKVIDLLSRCIVCIIVVIKIYFAIINVHTVLLPLMVQLQHNSSLLTLRNLKISPFIQQNILIEKEFIASGNVKQSLRKLMGLFIARIISNIIKSNYLNLYLEFKRLDCKVSIKFIISF